MLDEAERTLVNLLRGEAGSVAGEKYSFVRATDAEQIARAQELEAQGENAKTIWSETHLTRDGGGAWVREINDRGAKPRPDGDARGETGGRLADYLEHPEYTKNHTKIGKKAEPCFYHLSIPPPLELFPFYHYPHRAIRFFVKIFLADPPMILLPWQGRPRHIAKAPLAKQFLLLAVFQTFR